MMSNVTRFNEPEEIERLLAHRRRVKEEHPDAPNLPTVERSPTAAFYQEVAAATHLCYVRSGEKNYAVARLLSELQVFDYAMFCGQQSVENYLKAYIKSLGKQPSATHSLAGLLSECRDGMGADSFLASDAAETIAQVFDPFNEIARYPVHRTGPKGRAWTLFYPDDMYILDYFVFRMRELLPVPENQSTLFRSRHGVLGGLRKEHPEVFALIWRKNINQQAPE